MAVAWPSGKNGLLWLTESIGLFEWYQAGAISKVYVSFLNSFDGDSPSEMGENTR